MAHLCGPAARCKPKAMIWRSLLNPISLFHRIWPVAGIGAGLIATAMWIAFLVYELFRLAI